MPNANVDDAGNDAGLYGIAGAAAYLGISESYVYKLAARDGKLRFWQLFPPKYENGTMTPGSPLIFKREWLDEWKATKTKRGWPKGKPRKPRKQF